MQDYIRRFLLNNLNVRGHFVSLEQELTKMHQYKTYPQAINDYLNQLTAITALLANSLKFDGSLTCQLRMPENDLYLLVAEVSSKGKIRSVAEFNETADEFFIKSGTLTMIIENGDNKYTSLIELTSNDLCESINEYFKQSEQLPTKFFVSCDATRVKGLLLQQLPTSAESQVDDAFNHAIILAETLKEEELLNDDLEDLLHKLYHQEEVILYEKEHIAFECKCSQEKCESILLNFGLEEVQNQLDEQNGIIEMDCHFCAKKYLFNQDIINNLFHNNTND